MKLTNKQLAKIFISNIKNNQFANHIELLDGFNNVEKELKEYFANTDDIVDIFIELMQFDDIDNIASGVNQFIGGYLNK